MINHKILLRFRIRTIIVEPLSIIRSTNPPRIDQLIVRVVVQGLSWSKKTAARQTLLQRATALKKVAQQQGQ